MDKPIAEWTHSYKSIKEYNWGKVFKLLKRIKKKPKLITRFSKRKSPEYFLAIWMYKLTKKVENELMHYHPPRLNKWIDTSFEFGKRIVARSNGYLIKDCVT